MALKYYSNSGLTNEITSKNFVHLTDGSNDPQDFQFWIAPNVSGKRYQAASNPGVDQIVLSIKNNTALRANSTAYALNDRVRFGNGYRYKCIVAGTSAASPPTPSTTIGATFADGTVTWEVEREVHEATEIKLAGTQGGLAGATAGASFNLGTQIDSGSSVPVWMRIDDATGEQSSALTDLYLEIAETAESNL